MVDDPVTESAKALQETARTGGKAIDLVQGTTDWVGEVIGGPIKEAVGLYVTDKLSRLRLERAIYSEVRLDALRRKLDSLTEGEALAVRPLPPKVALPLLEAATMEFDDDLQTLWAQLLRSAIDERRDPIERQHVSILAELSADDAKALQDFWSDWQSRKHEKPYRDGSVRYGPNVETGSWGEAIAANLFRLGLIKPSYTFIANYVPEESNRYGVFGPSSDDIEVPTSLDFVQFTAQGERFCRALGLPESESQTGPGSQP